MSLSSCRFSELRNKRSLILIVQETAKGEGGSSGCKMIQLVSANPLLTPTPGSDPPPGLNSRPSILPQYQNISTQNCARRTVAERTKTRVMTKHMTVESISHPVSLIYCQENTVIHSYTPKGSGGGMFKWDLT